MLIGRCLLEDAYCPRTRAWEREIVLNPITTDDKCTHHATLATCYQLAQFVLKIGFALAKKDGIGGSGQVSAQGVMHMALAGCRKALVSTGLGISLLFDTNGCRKGSSAFLGAPFLALLAVSSQERSIHCLEGSDHYKLTNEWVWQRS